MKMLAALCAALALTACAAVPPAPKTPAQIVYEVKAAFVSAEDAGLSFAEQVCPDPKTCQDSRVKAVAKALVAADTAIAAAEKTVRALPSDASDAQAAAAGAQNALDAFKAILAQYGVTTTSSGSN